jgi:hypothetical protein
MKLSDFSCDPLHAARRVPRSTSRHLGIWGTDFHDRIARRTVIAALLHPRGVLVASVGNRGIGHQMPIAQIDVKTMPCNVRPAGKHYGTLIASEIKPAR